MTADVAQLIRQSVPWVVLLWVACWALSTYERQLELEFLGSCVGYYTPAECRVDIETGNRPSLAEVGP